MNTETGQIYTDPEEIMLAKMRGEPLRELSQEEFESMTAREARRAEMKPFKRSHAQRRPLHAGKRR